jgi:CDP-diacylglycerol--serine O-phosphatidyltransferase
MAIRRGIYLLPNLLTTAALFAGFFAVVAAMDGNFQKAAVAIFVAMVMDGLDGRVARLTSTESDFGKEFDSLADMVSFGIAPALVVYQWGVVNLTEYAWLWGRLGWLAAFFFAVCAAFRLARYNTRIGLADKRFFEGLPSPSGAAIVASMVWLGTKYGLGGPIAFLVAFVVTASAGALMVSTFPFYSGRDVNLGERIPFTYLLAIPAVFMLISLDPPLVLFALFFLFALSGPVLSVFRWAKRRKRRAQREERDAQDRSKAA